MESIDIEAFTRHLQENVRFASHVGLQIDTIEPGRAVFHLDVQDMHMNGADLVHGGVHATLMDSAMAVALLGLGLHGATSQMNVYYLEPVRSGRLICEGSVLHRTGRTATVEAKVRTETGDLVALASASFRIFKASESGSASGESSTGNQVTRSGR